MRSVPWQMHASLPMYIRMFACTCTHECMCVRVHVCMCAPVASVAAITDSAAEMERRPCTVVRASSWELGAGRAVSSEGSGKTLFTLWHLISRKSWFLWLWLHPYTLPLSSGGLCGLLSLPRTPALGLLGSCTVLSSPVHIFSMNPGA